jgi:hypothetical protein
MVDGAYSQGMASLDNWSQWLSPGAEDSQGTAGRTEAPLVAFPGYSCLARCAPCRSEQTVPAGT